MIGDTELITELFRDISDGVCVSAEGGGILYLNPAALELLALGAEPRLDGKTVCELICSKLSGASARGACPVRQRGGSAKAVNAEGLFDPGSPAGPRALRVRCQRMPTALLDSWENEKIFTTIEDLSAERALERHKEEWRNMIVHDLRSPLTSIYGTLKVLEESPPGKEQAEAASRLVTNSLRSCERVIKLLQLYLDVARFEAAAMPVDPVDCGLAEIVSRCVEELRASSESRAVALDAHVPAGLRAFADPELLMRICENLVSNALKFAPRDSRIVLAGKRVDAASVELSCKDAGPGIAPEDVPKIFDRFYQARGRNDGPRTGAGLGLAFCKAAAAAMGGEIDVLSRPGSGTEFFVRLPAARSISRGA